MRVLAKAYRDRPLDRETTGENERVIYLVGISKDGAEPEACQGVGFPKDSVFRFDEELFGKLVSAWAVGDQQALAKLWEQATPYSSENASR